MSEDERKGVIVFTTIVDLDAGEVHVTILPKQLSAPNVAALADTLAQASRNLFKSLIYQPEGKIDGEPVS